MTIPKLTPYTGQVANPDGSQTQTEFTQNMFDQLSYEAQLANDINATVDGMNQTASEVEENTAAASQSAAAAEASASTAGYQGLWPATGGSAEKGEIWQTQVSGTPTGNYFTALQNTTVDPVGDNVNWKAENDYGNLTNGLTVKQTRASNAEIMTTVLEDGRIAKNDDDGSLHVGDGVTQGGVKHINTSILPDYTNLTVDTVADLKSSDFKVGTLVKTKGYYSAGDGGGGVYLIAVSQPVDGFGGHALTNGSVALLQKSDPIPAKQYGAKLDGVTDDQAALNAAGEVGRVLISTSTVNVSVAVNGVFISLSDVTVSGAGSITIKNLLSNDGSDLENLPLAHDGGSRSTIQYGSASSVKIRDTQFPMSGFRFHGQYKKKNVPIFSSASQQSTISTLTDLAFGMTSDVKENWYAVFACANNGDANVTFQIVPFLRVESVSVNTVTLRKAGEAVHSSAPQTYTWPSGALNGAECLVITETVDGRPVAFSGRETTIISSTTTTIELANIGNVADGDWLLPAPVGFDHYRYCGAFYMDTAEVRNIADSGTLVKSRGIFDQSGTNTGHVQTPEVRQPSGYISPLATSISFESSGVLSTVSVGQIVENFGIDSAHVVARYNEIKETSASKSYISSEILIPLMFGPQYYYSNAGALATSRSNGQQNIWGWIEP